MDTKDEDVAKVLIPYLLQARGIAPEDPLVQTAWAYLLFKKAVADPRSVSEAKKEEEARTMLLGLVARRGSADSYPFHILGAQGLAWSRRAELSTTERRGYISRLLDQVESGIRLHPGAAELPRLHEDARREVLLTAVSGLATAEEGVVMAALPPLPAEDMDQ